MITNLTPLYLVFWFYSAAVTAFQFTFTSPKSCGNLDVSWSGGQPPFTLNVVPVFGIPFDVSIPTSAFSNGAGKFSTTLSQLNNSGVVLAMSDATGFAAGGISEVQKLSLDIGNCKPADSLSWTYDNPLPLTQCANFLLNSNGAFAPPVSFTGLVPGGSFFTLNDTNHDKAEWLTNVPAQTQFIFVGKDSQGKPGGSTGVLTVAESNDSSCLSQDSKNIATTTNVPSASSTSSTSQTNSASHDGHSGSNSSLIAGLVGGILGAVALVSVSYFCYQSRRKRQGSWERKSRRPIDIEDVPMTQLPAGYTPNPFMFQVPQVPQDDVDMVGRSEPASGATAIFTSRTKVPAPSSDASRLMVHTDIDEVQVSDVDLIELPPQYSASRRPLSRFTGSNSGTIESSTSTAEGSADIKAGPLRKN